MKVAPSSALLLLDVAIPVVIVEILKLPFYVRSLSTFENDSLYEIKGAGNDAQRRCGDKEKAALEVGSDQAEMIICIKLAQKSKVACFAVTGHHRIGERHNGVALV